jgi:hypothetical protein
MRGTARVRGAAARRVPGRVLAGVFTALAALAGCAGPNGTMGPAAWDKSFIAKPEMSMGYGRQAVKFDQHVYDSKEGASGGYGVGGGGCGCN